MNYIDPARKLTKHLERVWQLEKGFRPSPINVEIDLSNRCSLGCEWCHFSHTHTRGPLADSPKPESYIETGDLIELPLILTIINQLEQFGVKSITWSGGGEPTLYPHFDEIITKVQIDQGMYTHGGHIDQNRAKILKEKFEWVYVSLDCTTPSEYARVKQVQPGRFDKACQGIRNLAQAPGKATIGVGFLLNENNCEDMLDMIYLGRTLGATYIQFRPTILYDHVTPGKLIENCNWVDTVVKEVQEFRIADKPDVEIDISRFEMYRNWAGHGYNTCWWSGLQAVITPNGKVWGCVNKRGNRNASLGDLTEETFANVWQRSAVQGVNNQCRIMCRGHIPNMALNQIFERSPHENFI